MIINDKVYLFFLVSFHSMTSFQKNNKSQSCSQETLVMTNITNEHEYNEIINTIERFYERNYCFFLIIETKNVRNVHFHYLYKFGNYLNQLRNRNPQELQETQIYVYDDFIYNLLYTLFVWISKPVAPVKVIYYNGGYSDISNEKKSIKKIKNYYPKI